MPSGPTSSMATIAPRPRASPTPGCGRGHVAGAARASRHRSAGRARAALRSPWCRWPPSPPRTPAGSRRRSPRGLRGAPRPCSSARPVIAAMGRPPPRLLAVVTMSGTTSSCSHANHAPVRPKPDWISSATKTTPLARHQCASPASQPGSGTTNPPSPAMGSTTTQAICDAPTVVSSDVDGLVERARAPEGIGVRGPVDLGRERAESLLVGHGLAREAHAHAASGRGTRGRRRRRRCAPWRSGPPSRRSRRPRRRSSRGTCASRGRPASDWLRRSHTST